MSFDWKQYHVPVQVSSELVRDHLNYAGVVERALVREMNEAFLDITVGPRYGPPAPLDPEPERCECCGQTLYDEWDD